MSLEAILVLMIPIVAIIGIVLIVAMRTLANIIRPNNKPYGRTRQENLDETQLIQEMYRGLQRMEERVEALETILMDIDRRNRDRHNGE